MPLGYKWYHVDYYVSLWENQTKQDRTKQNKTEEAEKKLNKSFGLLIQSCFELRGIWVVQAASWGFNAQTRCGKKLVHYQRTLVSELRSPMLACWVTVLFPKCKVQWIVVITRFASVPAKYTHFSWNGWKYYDWSYHFMYFFHLWSIILCIMEVTV